MVKRFWETTSLLLQMTLFKRIMLILPFAFIGMILAAGGFPSWQKSFWILVAIIAARNLGMALNRLIDQKIDSENPRTRERLLPSGQLKRWQVYLFSFVMMLVFIFSTAMLNPLCLKLSPIPLALIILYPFMKRFSCYLHLILGVIMAFAPFGSWVAIRGSIDFPAIILAMAVASWVAGFDIISDMRDVDYYKTRSLFSLPSRFGIEHALIFARLFHVATLSFLFWLYYVMPLGVFYLAGLFIVGGFLLYEHILASEDNQSKVPAAFMVNTAISSTMFFFTLIDVYYYRL